VSLNLDVLIAGAGPAGLATALAVRLAGMSLMVLDRRRPPLDKACGESTMPAGVAALGNLGIPLRDRQAIPFRGIRFIKDGIFAEGRFVESFALGIRRTTLSQLLLERALSLCVTVRWGARIERRTNCSVRVANDTFHFKWLVGADGHNSQTRSLASIRPVNIHRRLGVSQHYKVDPWTDLVEVYWHERGQAYVTPIAFDETKVVLMGNDETLRITDVAELFPGLRDRLARAEPVGKPQYGVTASFGLRTITRNRTILIGDASGSVEAITGNSLSPALCQSLLLARALVRDDLNSYAVAHRRLLRIPQIMGRLLLAMGRRGWLQGRVAAALADESTAFTGLLAVHTEQISVLSVKRSIVAGLLVGSLLHEAGS